MDQMDQMDQMDVPAATRNVTAVRLFTFVAFFVSDVIFASGGLVS